MKLLQIITIIFIIWEIIKIIKAKTIWNEVKNQWLKKDNSTDLSTIQIISAIYMVYNIGLFFTRYWVIGLLLAIVAIITSIIMHPYIKNNEPYSNKAKAISYVDSIISIIILLKIVL